MVVIVSKDLSLVQVAHGLSETIITASDKELELFQKIIQESFKLRDGHKNLQHLIQSVPQKAAQ